MKIRIFLTLIVASISAVVCHAQSTATTTTTNTNQVWLTAHQSAYAAAAGGNLSLATTYVGQAVSARQAVRGVPVETGEEWARISFELREGLDPTHAQAASAQAISVLAGVEAGTSTDYAVWAATLEGNLYERVNHDRTKARAAYVRALQKNPNSQAAAAGVARIDLQDAVTAVKIKEQQVLQQAPKTGN
jgi:hypothetical protein